ncbi:MAG: FkbM family methyltransferase [Bacteroidota bacterium]
MNYTPPHDFKKSGELFAIKWALAHSETSNSKFIAFDVGANIGEYSYQLHDLSSKIPHEIFAFEPVNSTFQKLRQNLALHPNISIHQIGLGEKEEKSFIYLSPRGSDLASVHRKDNNQMAELITITTLDIFCKRCGINQINFLKIDVEGNELATLKGARSMLDTGAIKTIQFEFGKSNVYSRVFFRDIYNYLNERNYKLFRVLQDSFEPIIKYHETMEVFMTTNYVAHYNCE